MTSGLHMASTVPSISIGTSGVSVAAAPTGTDSSTLSMPPARIAEEFLSLLHRSQEYFIGLRDLPTYACSSVWLQFFQKTFSSFTRLWKFQQLHRVVLEQDDVCGLKRHEIGEIASKIGQIYYYYLRTSDTGYLLESFQFYEAVWDRKYFDHVMDTRLVSVASKRLRYCARFMIVCLLLSRWDRVQVLVVECKKFVDQFNEVLDPLDKEGWRKVYGDMALFIDVLSHAGCVASLVERTPPNLRLPALDLTIHDKPKGLIGEAIVCCCWPNQAKFSDLSIDMYRIQHVLERDPVKCNMSDIKDTDSAKKYLLYMPSVTAILTHLSCSLKELNPSQAVLFYFSGPGASASSSSGIGLSPGTSIDLLQCGLDVKVPDPTLGAFDVDHEFRFHVTDLMPFMRSPIVVVIDSPASHVFRKVPRIYLAPFLFLLSPLEHPVEHQEQWDERQSGSLFTSFLAHPVVALTKLCNLSPVAKDVWDHANAELKKWESNVIGVLLNHDQSSPFIVELAKDDYMRRLISRFAIARVVLTHHVHFLKTTELPCCHPDLSDVLWTELEVISRDSLSNMLSILNCQSHFR